MTLKLQDIRRLAVSRALFPATTLARAVARLGFVQADPIAAPARAQDLILRHRVKNYRAGDLERRYPDLDLDEDMLHVYGYMPRGVSPLLHPRVGQWRVESEYPKLAQEVLKFIQSSGEIGHRELERHLGKMSTQGNWGGQANATTRVLEMLHYRGHLRVARRTGNARRFVAVTLPDLPPPAERLRRLALLLIGLYAPVHEQTARQLVNSLRYAAPSLDSRRTIIGELLKSGELESAIVEGVNYLWPAGGRLGGEVPPEVRFLAPFDPVVWDRRRFEHIWGWPYRFEAYTPAPKRQWGYYALPVLWRDKVIGWANVARLNGDLQVELGFVNRRPSGKEFTVALEAERERLQTFLTRGRARLEIPKRSQ